MTEVRATKALKTLESQDVSAATTLAATAVQQRLADITDEQRQIQYLLFQIEQQKGHLVVLDSQQEHAQQLFNLTLRHRYEFFSTLQKLNNVTVEARNNYLLALAQYQRNECAFHVTQQWQYRDFLYASYFMGAQQPQQQSTTAHQTQAPVVPTNTTSGGAATNQTGLIVPTDVFAILGEDIHRHILSFLMVLKDGRAKAAKYPAQLYVEANRESHKAKNPTLANWQVDSALAHTFRSLTEEQQGPWNVRAEQDMDRYHKEEASFVRPFDLAEICFNLSLVSKHWNAVVGDVMNAKAPTEIVSKRQVAKLKSRACVIDLSKIGQHFIKLLKEKWGQDMIMDEMYGEELDEGALDLVIQHFGGTKKFAELVANEYRQFLVVKAVESIARYKYYGNNDETTPSTVLAWKEKCQPSLLVDVMWHAHMQAPQKYALDCHLLLGDMLGNGTDFSIGYIINHDAGYVSSNTHVGSDYTSKHGVLFAFEKQFPAKDYFGGRLDGGGHAGMLFSKDFKLGRVAAEIWQDMQGWNDCG